MNAIAIITARGGSKRIPKKNIKEFCGKPIIAYSIEAALSAGIFDEVMVSTDSEEIAEIARRYGAKVPFMRSEYTSSDYATTSEVLFEVLNEYEKRGCVFKYMVCIYPTAPFVTSKKLRDGMCLLKEKGAAVLMPVVEFSFPPQRGSIINENGLEMVWKENVNVRTQDLPKMYHDCGQFYIYNIEQFKERNGVIVEGVVPMIMDPLEVQDIDNESDWKIAEIKYKMLLEE